MKMGERMAMWHEEQMPHFRHSLRVKNIPSKKTSTPLVENIGFRYSIDFLSPSDTRMRTGHTSAPKCSNRTNTKEVISGSQTPKPSLHPETKIIYLMRISTAR